MVCDRHINLNSAADAALRPFTAGTVRIKQFKWEHDLTSRLHISTWLLKRTQSLLVCMQARFGPPHSYDRAEKWTTLYKMAGDSAQEDSDGQGHNSFLMCYARVWSRASPLQVVPGGSVVVQC